MVVTSHERKRDTMTRKDYEAVASVMRKHLREYNEGSTDSLYAWGAICNRLAMEFSKQNVRFEKAKFLNACGWVEAWGYEAR